MVSSAGDGAQVALEHPCLKKGAGCHTVTVARARVGEKPWRKRGTSAEHQP